MTKKQKILSAIGAVAGIAIVYFAIDYILFVTTDDAQVDAHSVMISAKVGGYVKTVLISEGQKVKKNDILIEIDDRDYQNALTQFKGELASNEARETENEKNYYRIQDLYKKGAATRQQYDNALASYTDSKARYESSAAQVAQAELNLENTIIRAPSNGTIARKSVEIGQLASIGVPLIGFVSAEERWITANFKETDLDAVNIGAKARVYVDAIPGKTYIGKVESISAATGATFSLLPPDNATGNFTKVVQRVPVKIVLDNLNDKDIDLLRAGLSAFVKVSKH